MSNETISTTFAAKTALDMVHDYDDLLECVERSEGEARELLQRVETAIMSSNDSEIVRLREHFDEQAARITNDTDSGIVDDIHHVGALLIRLWDACEDAISAVNIPSGDEAVAACDMVDDIEARLGEAEDLLNDIRRALDKDEDR